MGIQFNPSDLHWNYFLALEEDFSKISRFIEPCEENLNTFSIELARLLMSAAQEVDVVLQDYCKLLDPTTSASGINQYHEVIARKDSEFLAASVTAKRFGLSSAPWEDWDQGTPPIWWTANNKVKHARASEFNRATLKNAYNSLSALLLSICFSRRAEASINDISTDWRNVLASLTPSSNLLNYDSGDIYLTVNGVDYGRMMAVSPIDQ